MRFYAEWGVKGVEILIFRKLLNKNSKERPTTKDMLCDKFI
jgi:hypothetical protein